MVYLLLQLAFAALLFTCAKAQSYGELRLVHREDGSSPAAGLLEIFLNGEWGTICDSGFDIIDANVACRQMGHRAAINYATAFHSPFSIGKQNQSVWLSNIDCRDPNGLHLLSCAHGEVGVHNYDCDHYFDVAVMCDERPLSELQDGSVRLTGGVHKSQGIIEIACGGKWRTVCGGDALHAGAQGTTSFSQNEANAICWQLGFTEASSYVAHEIPVGDNSSLDDQQSSRSWYDLPPCTNDYQSCTFTCSDNQMSCSANQQSSNVTYGIWVECNHTITYGTLRLAAHARHGEISRKSQGRLEIFIEGQWGTVCAATFGSREADVACQQLGYYRALWYNRSNAVAVDKEVYNTVPVALTGVKCTAEDNKVAYCSRHQLPEGMTCMHNDDIILACTNDPTVTTGAEVVTNSWPLPFSKRFLIEISTGAGLGLILCCCCLVVWCSYCCCQHSKRRNKRKMSQLLLPDTTLELGITQDPVTKQQDVIVLAAQVQDRLKPSPVSCTSPMAPQESQESSVDIQNASNAASPENTEQPANNNGEEGSNNSMSASLAGPHMEPEGVTQMVMEEENEGGREKGRQWVGFFMEPIPEEKEGEFEGDGCEQMTLESVNQPSAIVGDQVQETGRENITNGTLGMDWATMLQILDENVENTNRDQLETEI